MHGRFNMDRGSQSWSIFILIHRIHIVKFDILKITIFRLYKL